MIDKTHFAGFDALYEVPLQSDQIENQIKPLINKRMSQNIKKELIKQKVAENYENQIKDIHKAMEIRKKEREEEHLSEAFSDKLKLNKQITEVVVENINDDLSSSKSGS